MLILGISKTLYNSSIAIFSIHRGLDAIEVILTERITRIKASKSWPHKAISYFNEQYYRDHDFYVSENRDVLHPKMHEESLESVIPFESRLGKLSQLEFLSKSKTVEYVGHHLAHAYSAAAFSPFKRCLILVIDGAGSKLDDLPDYELHGVKLTYDQSQKELYEEYSLYELENNEVKCLAKSFQHFFHLPDYKTRVTAGIGISYEVIADFIFGSNLAAGKVMGLASFGKKLNISSTYDLLNSLDWSKSFKGKEKESWEVSPHLSYYQDLAATMQHLYEEHLNKITKSIRHNYPAFKSLILTGGSALNVVSNTKLLNKNYFENVYIPPAPDDRGISVGLAMKKYVEQNGKDNITGHSYLNQKSSFGKLNSVPSDFEIEQTFRNYTVTKMRSPAKEIAKLLMQNQIIALFNGRSEIGPRALGNRSIIANPMISNLKNYLNNYIKFREQFRPYGASCTYESKDLYFKFPNGLECPFMSFSLPVRPEYKDHLKSVTHTDGTSRVQTVRNEQNQYYHEIIEEFGKLSGIACILNTSLNIMGEPIVETIQDLKKFMDNSVINYAIVEKYLIQKR